MISNCVVAILSKIAKEAMDINNEIRSITLKLEMVLVVKLY